MRKFTISFFLAWFLVSPGLAIEALHLQMKTAEGEDWTLSGLSVDVDLLTAQSANLDARVEQLILGNNRLEMLTISCPLAQTQDTAIVTCTEGRVGIARSLLGAIKGRLSWQYETPDQWLLQLKRVTFPRGYLDLKVQAEAEQIIGTLKLKGLDLSRLKPFFPQGWVFSGSLDVQGKVVFKHQLLHSLVGSAVVKNFSYSNQDSMQVGEELAAHFDFNLKKSAKSWQGNLSLDIRQGQVYSDPFFLEIKPEQSLSLKLAGNLMGEYLDISAGQLHLGSQMSANGSMKLNLGNGMMKALQLSYSTKDMDWLYATLGQPLLIGTAMDDMTVSGTAQGQLSIVEGEVEALALHLRRLDLEQNAGLFGLRQGGADLYWQRSEVAKTSRIYWQQGHLYKIEFQALEAKLDASAGNIVLQPSSLALLGGELKLDKLQVGGLLGDKLTWQTQAELESLQLDVLSKALGWPVLRGSLQATIPRLYFEDATLRMDGELQIEVFGGEVVVEGLQLQDALGVAPALETSIRLTDLDLEQITQVLDFGRIQGSLEGYIRNLRMVAWQVTGFEANLHSPSKDKRKHRISQRAIDNLTELGNGVSANLGATMLGIFDDFAYKQLALKVGLRGAVAELDGVPAPQGGYYIVQGARLPRIDVIGRNHQVAWKDLLSRIRDIRFDDMIVE